MRGFVYMLCNCSTKSTHVHIISLLIKILIRNSKLEISAALRFRYIISLCENKVFPIYKNKKQYTYMLKNITDFEHDEYVPISTALKTLFANIIS